MFDFSGDEWLFFWAALGVSAVAMLRWGMSLARTCRMGASGSLRLLLVGAPIAGSLIILLTLQTWADPVYVVGHADYVLLFLVGGIMWIALFTWALPMLGFSSRDDAVERNNPAATIAVAGAVLGVSLAYAGSNVGNGPTIWTTLLPALVAAVSLLLLWWIAELIGPMAEALTIDRDVATAVRAAASAVATGALLGRAMAGDWYSWDDTFGGFIELAWPAVGLVVLLAISNRLLHPTPENPAPSVMGAGVVPAAIMLLATIVYLVTLGLPEVAPPGEYELAPEVEVQ